MSSGRRELRDVEATPLTIGARLRLIGRVAGLGAALGTGVLVGTGSLDLVRGTPVPAVEGAASTYLVPVRPRLSPEAVGVVAAAPVVAPIPEFVDAGPAAASSPSAPSVGAEAAAAAVGAPIAATTAVEPAVQERPPAPVAPIGGAPSGPESTAPEAAGPPSRDDAGSPRSEEPAPPPSEDPAAAHPVEVGIEPVQSVVDAALGTLG